ncbi:DEAD/DEAH box helicase [Allobranchiibius huperziae]|uniref:Superfamily II DNA/RNA helicase n=1 Tax=Allobranchiibius huperziae TaxID=1874116 RepID=A0A853DG26_9MICO|nr:DEAD/DEAH box helicase [Allobranchiibius huperziae]NYJ74014.1 superfamily II DNA/RNA helicase [Allobranchiibius huperziae]
MSTPKQSGPKKQRWSRAQKLEAQRAPVRRADGAPSRSAEGPRSADRRQGSAGGPRSYGSRDQRPSYNRDDRADRGERRSYGNREDRPSYNRDNRSDRNEPRSYGNRDDRPSYNRADRGERRTPSNRAERGDRPSYNRDDRPTYNRSDRSDRSEPRSYGNRDDRPTYNRSDRSEPRPYGNRDDRPTYNRSDRSEPRSYGNRDDRPRYNRADRDERGGERRTPSNRSDRPSYNRDDRGERRSYGNREDRPSYGRGPRDEHRSSRPRSDERTYPRTDHRFEPKADSPVTQQIAPVDTAPAAPEKAAVHTPDGPNGFEALGLPETLVRRLARDGITTPFPIQEATIPDALAGRDVLGRGRTGSGKTLAFGLPALTRLAQGGKARPGCPRAIVLVPTRELAMQVADALQPLVHAIGLHHKLVAGGMPYEPQLQALARGVDLLIATPGRLMDLIDRGAADLSRVEIAVLDEADHMAEMGFLEDITKILDDVPAGGQRLLFSATLDSGIDTVVDRYLIDPVTHSTDDGTVSVTNMAHHALLIEPRDKKVVTAEVANREGRTVVFSRTKLGADRIASELREQGVLAAALHGGLNQGQRNKVLSAFKDGRIPVLVATDVAARGIHVDDVGVVLQVDPPADHKDYLHRAGRTARAGEAGTVVTLALPHQRKAVTRLLEQAGVESGLQRARPGDEVIRATGGRTPQERSISDQDLHRILTPKREAGRGGGRGGSSRGGSGRPGNYRGGPGGGSGRRTDGPYRGRPRG